MLMLAQMNWIIEGRVAMPGAGSTIVSDVGVMMAIVGNEGPMSCGHLRQSRPGHHLYQGLDKTKQKTWRREYKKIDRDNNNDTHATPDNNKNNQQC